MRIGEIYQSLSPIRRAIYDYVKSREYDTGEGVRIRDIAEHIGLVVSNTHFHVKVLCDLGLLYQDKGRHFRITGAVTTVLMPDENTEIVDANKLDRYHLTAWQKIIR